jgi:hypothetical protein
VGEYIADAAVRETKEETGMDIEVTGLVGLYTNPGHVMAYDDEEVCQQCSAASPAGYSVASNDQQRDQGGAVRASRTARNTEDPPVDETGRRPRHP